jgi:type 2A phosphatase activator TIP41
MPTGSQRVMPSSFFLLARFFLRVDHVLFRIFDVRLYHDFSSNEVIRELKGKEAPYDRVKQVRAPLYGLRPRSSDSDAFQRLPRERPDDLTPLTDSNWVANALGMLENDRPSASTARPVPSVTSATGAPWAAASQARQQIAPGVSIPVRTPLSMPPAPAALPSTGIEAAGESSRKKWKGIGTRLEVAVLD